MNVEEQMAKKKVEIPTLVVASKVKERIKENDIRVSGEFMEQLNMRVDHLIGEAIERARENKRGTVKPCDL